MLYSLPCDKYFIIRAKNILQAKKYQTNRGFHSKKILNQFDVILTTRELIRMQNKKKDNYKNIVNFNLS